MNTVDVGDGAPRAVLVHGNGLCAAFYAPFAERLAERGVPIRLVTLPGFHGEPPLARPGWEGLVDAVRDVTTPGMAVMGHSLGGLIALLVAARRPGSDLVLLEPALFTSRPLAVLASRGYAAPAPTFANWNGGMWRVADPARYPAEAVALFEAGARSDDPETGRALFATLPSLYPLPFDRVSGRTLLVTGARTGWRGRLLAWQVARRLHAERFVLPGAAHWLVNEDDAALATVVAAFLRGGGGRSA